VDDAIRSALENDQLIDITTTGRVTGTPHKIEIRLRYFGPDAIYVTGRTQPKDWYLNMVANPQMTVHLKQSTQADLPATATPITDPARREAILNQIIDQTDSSDEVRADWLAQGVLVQLHLAAD
jgi:hypothetical protein